MEVFLGGRIHCDVVPCRGMLGTGQVGQEGMGACRVYMDRAWRGYKNL